MAGPGIVPVFKLDDPPQVLTKAPASKPLDADHQVKTAQPLKGCLSVCGSPPRGDPFHSPARGALRPRTEEASAKDMDVLVDPVGFSEVVLAPKPADVKLTKYMNCEVGHAGEVGAPSTEFNPNDTDVPGEVRVPVPTIQVVLSHLFMWDGCCQT